MRILLAEYGVSIGMGGTILLEGRAILRTLVDSFTRMGHEVVYTSANTTLPNGKPVGSDEDSFERVLEQEARRCDAGLVVAPDELLSGFTQIMEDNTVNLGCSAESVALCADKLKCGQFLDKHSINIPPIVQQPEGGTYVLKPRHGCASEGIKICSDFQADNDIIATEYIEGEHLSVSLIAGEQPLPLTINKQIIEIDPDNKDSAIDYRGSITPYQTPRKEELYEVATSATTLLKCSGYVGVDIVLADKPYVVEVNPRLTTSIFGISKVMKEEIADLLLKNKFGELPTSVEMTGQHSFTKEDLK